MIAPLVNGYVRYLARKRLVLKPTSTLTYAALLGLKALSNRFSDDRVEDLSPEPLWTVESITHVRTRDRIGRELLQELVRYLTERLPPDAQVSDAIPEIEVEAELLSRSENLAHVLRNADLPFEINGVSRTTVELDLRLIELFLLLDHLSESESDRYVKPFVITCFETLSDYIDVLDLRWSHVDPIKRRITVRGRVRTISRHLAQELLEMPRRGESVFPITSVEVARWERTISRKWGHEFRFL
ncbi:MAG: hypothetical protein ABGY09_06540 [Euryarchaeota archaeon]